jgi:ABC-2 type transport system permease protein
MIKVLSIARNTFTEIIRQPVYAVIIIAALFLFVLSPSITMYTMADDNKMLREIGLSTLFLSGLFIAVFAASGAITEEFESKTITTVLSKPIQRPAFILGKFLGISAAVTLAQYICTIALLLSLRHGVMETASDELDYVVIVAAAIVLLITLLLTAFLNYFYDWNFPATAICIGTCLGTAALAALCFISKDLKFDPAHNGFQLFDVYASILLLMATLIIVSLAVVFSSRFNIVVTLTCCIGIFLLGLISDYIFLKIGHASILARAARAIIPNLQVFWISDAIYEGSPIPLAYLPMAAIYSLCYIGAILLIAVAVFQRRQVD